MALDELSSTFASHFVSTYLWLILFILGCCSLVGRFADLLFTHKIFRCFVNYIILVVRVAEWNPTASLASQVVWKTEHVRQEWELTADCHGVTEVTLTTALGFCTMTSSIESLERPECAHELVTSLGVEVFPGAFDGGDPDNRLRVPQYDQLDWIIGTPGACPWTGHFLECGSVPRSIADGTKDWKLARSSGKRNESEI